MKRGNILTQLKTKYDEEKQITLLSSSFNIYRIYIFAS